MKTKLLCLITSVVLMACGKPEQSSPPSAAPPGTQAPVSAPAMAKSDGLKIKGFQIGMDIQSVPNVMMTLLAERELAGFGFTDVIRLGDGSQCVLMYTKPFLRAKESRMRDRYGEAKAQAKVDEELVTSCINSDGVLAAKAGADSKVIRIEFNDVKDLFNAKGMAPADFVKNLSKENHLPDMKPNDTQTVWSAISPDGTKVEVDAKEVLGIPMVRLYMSKAAP